MRDNQDAILAQIGITQWRLRGDDSVAKNSGLKKDKVDVLAQSPKAATAAKPADPSNNPDSSVEPEKAKSKAVIPMSEIKTLQDLREHASLCTACALSNGRTQTVFGSGAESADWMFIGEAPSPQEDKQGKSFIGRAGQLFSQILRALGESRESVYISHIVKCKTAKGQSLSADCIASCEPILRKQVKLIQPKIMVALGQAVAQSLLKTDEPIEKLRGKLHPFAEGKTQVLVTYSPASLLRQPADKAKVWADLLLAAQALRL